MQVWHRAIILMDMNAFFASVEQLDNPELRGKPIGVTNGKTGTCFITCSYEARAFGIKTGMRFKEAKSLCPDVIQVAARAPRYVEISTRIMSALRDNISPEIEVFSVDECFLDVTRCQKLLGHPIDIAKKAKQVVQDVSGLLCSVGLSGDKTTAKYAAKLQKPDGFTVIPPWESKQRLKNVPVTDLCGINKGIGKFLADRGVKVCGDMEKLPIGTLAQRFGSPGRRIWYMAQGLDPAKLDLSMPAPKSIGHGKVMPPNTKNIDVIYVYLRHMSEKVAARLREHDYTAQVFHVGLLTKDGWIASNKLRSEIPTSDGRKIMELCKYLLYKVWHGEGVSQCQVTALDPRLAGNQEDMFTEIDAKAGDSNNVMDAINDKYGEFALCPAPLVNRSDMPNVIAPGWRPYGHRQTIKV